MKRLYCFFACLCATVAALEFVPQDIPDIEVGPVNALTGQAAVNFRLADFNGDGRGDLLLPRYMLFGAESGFAIDAPVAPPDVEQDAWCDIWKDRLYLRTGRGWRIVRWVDGEWLEDASAPHGAVTAPAPPEAPAPSGLRFRRFLHDIDVNGTPEIVDVREDGVHILQLDKNGLVELGVLNVLPPLRLARLADQALWPPERRRLDYPAQQLECRLVMEAASILVITRDDLGDARVRFSGTPYRIDTGMWTAFADQRDAFQTPPMPAYMQPCRLNQDAALDFAGGDWELTAARALPAPIHQTAASTDGGNTIQSVRSQSWAPQALFVDFEEDDDLDMVTEATGLFRGGLRDSLNRYTTDRTIQHEIAIYLQGPGGHFSEKPDVAASFTIKLDQAPLQQGDMLNRYQAGELINITGDFNGDGVKDCAVRTHGDSISIFLSDGNRISDTPAATVQVAGGIWRFDVAHVNGDGKSDLVVRTNTESGRTTTVYFSAEAAAP